MERRETPSGLPRTSTDRVRRGQVRGLLISEALSVTDELPGLHELAPGLARELTGLRDEMAAMDDRTAPAEPERPSLVPPQSRGEAAEARRLASARWDALLARIRIVPGLEGFWQRPSAGSLQPAAADGPVVIIFTNQERCDALILDGDNEHLVRVVPLPGLTDQEAAANAYHPDDAGQAQLDMCQTLEWLWETVADPILQTLAHVSPPGPDRPWPRVQWCPTGPLAALPLHAVGYRGDGRAVLDRVVSSYTPTVRALAPLRGRSHRTASGRACRRHLDRRPCVYPRHVRGAYACPDSWCAGSSTCQFRRSSHGKPEENGCFAAIVAADAHLAAGE